MVLGRFAALRVPTMDETQLEQFEQLLNQFDPVSIVVDVRVCASLVSRRLACNNQWLTFMLFFVFVSYVLYLCLNSLF